MGIGRGALVCRYWPDTALVGAFVIVVVTLKDIIGLSMLLLLVLWCAWMFAVVPWLQRRKDK